MRHPRCLLGWPRHQGGKDLVPGAFFEEMGSRSAVLTDDFLAGSTGGMTDGRKKKKGFHDSVGLECSISEPSYFRLIPVGSDWR